MRRILSWPAVVLSGALICGQVPAAAAADEATVPGSVPMTATPSPGRPAPAPAPAETATPPTGKKDEHDKADADRPKAGDPVPGSYIVMFAASSGLDTEAELDKAARDLTNRVGGSVKSVYSTVLQGFAAKMTAAQAREMAEQPEVASVTQDVVVKAKGTTGSAAAPGPAQTSPPWHLDRVDQATVPLSGTFDAGDAAKAHIYIFDTGVRASHEEFGGRVKDGPPGTDHDDCEGHGTAVAGVAAGKTYGVAKNATIHRVRLFDCEGYSQAVRELDAIEWVTEKGPRPAVVNLSWETHGDLNSPLAVAIRNSTRAGITYVVAGPQDDYDDCTTIPERIPEVITVSGVDRFDYRSSGGGDCVDLFAPGWDVPTASAESDTATQSAGGTSLASPIVAGAAAVHLSANPDATPQQVADALVACASTGYVLNPGPKSPNRLLNTACDTGGLRPANPGAQITVKGEQIRIDGIRVAGSDAGAVRYSATGLPEGVSIDPATGVISGAPTTARSTVVTVTATAGDVSASTRFAWDVVHGFGPFAVADGDFCLDNDHSRKAEGNKIQLWDTCGHIWRLRGDGRIEFTESGDRSITGTGYCAAVSEKESSDGRPIRLSRCSDSPAQVWEYRNDGTLRNPATGQCLTAPRISLAAEIVLSPCNGGAGQRWQVPTRVTEDPLRPEPREKVVTMLPGPASLRVPVISFDTTKRLRYSATGLPTGVSIDPDTGIISGTLPGPAPTTTVTVTVGYAGGGASASASFRWQVAHGRVASVNRQCLDVLGGSPDAGTPVQMWDCDHTVDQMWTVRDDGRLEGRGGCLMPRDGATGRGTPIVISPCANAATQVWRAGSDGTLRNEASGRCLSGPPSGGPAVQLTLEDCRGTAAPQIWTRPTDPSAGLIDLPERRDLVVGRQREFTITGKASGYRVTGLPEGMSFDAATRKVTGTPARIGRGDAVITATGPDGVTARASFTWSVHHGVLRNATGRCAANEGGDKRDDVPVVLERCDDDVARQWTVWDDGTLEVMGKCATVENNATAAGSPIVIKECAALPAQIWLPRDDGTLRNPASGRCLSAPVEEDADRLVLAGCTGDKARQWQLPTSATGPSPQPTGPTPQPTGLVSHATQDICVEPDGASDLKTWDCNRTPPQQWTALADGRLTDRDGLCLTTRNGGRTGGTAVARAKCDTADPVQVWRQQPDGTVRHTASGLCLTIRELAPYLDHHDYDGLFALQPCTAQPEQLWRIPVPPTAG